MKKLVYDVTIDRCLAIDPVTGIIVADPDAVCSLGSDKIDTVVSVEIDDSLDDLTNTAVVRFVKKIAYGPNDSRNVVAGNNPVFSKGHKVTIKAGYDYNNNKGPQLNTLFVGYITAVIPGTIVELQLQDKMWLLKHTPNTSFSCNTQSGLTLKTILAGGVLPGGRTVPGMLPKWALKNLKVIDATLGGYRVNENEQVAFELERLKDAGFFFSFKPDGSFYAGGRYLKNNFVSGDPHPSTIGAADVTVTPLKYEFNIISEDDMVFKTFDILMGVKGISVNDKKVAITYTYPENFKGGNLTKLKYTNTGMDLPTLKQRVVETFNKINYNGFQGAITTFLQPTVSAGQAIQLIHDRIPEKNGTYLIDRVETNISVKDGGRQKIHLDRQIT